MRRRSVYTGPMSAPLPIMEIRDSLLAAFGRESRLVLEAPTGSGKSTQVPQILLDGGAVPSGQIVVLQPRRIAARMLAERVAGERASAVGEEIGYQYRLASRTSRRTRVRYVTEGILLRTLLADPELRGIHTVIYDEFHERHLEGDTALALVLRLQQTLRPDLKLIVMSATLDSDRLLRHLAPCAHIRSEGRTFPVTQEYLPRPWDDKRVPVWDLAARELDRLAQIHKEGDVLVFMPGAYEIQRTVQSIRSSHAGRAMDVLPLHGQLAEREQDRALAPSAKRKVIVATNVAETSLTIPGVRLVIDSGLARIPRFDPHRGIDTLLSERISQASAEQRAGRAGRTAPGHCLRLWTESEQALRLPQTEPEIRRVDLCQTLLTLKATPLPATEDPRGTDPLESIRQLPWLDAPEEKTLQRCCGVLLDLDAIDRRSGKVTDLGRTLAGFPMHPRFARMLAAADSLGCVRTAALIAALTQERSLLLPRQADVIRESRDLRFDTDSGSDFFRLIQVWEYARSNSFDLQACARLGIHAVTARRVEQIWEFFLRAADSEGLRTDQPEGDPVSLCKCILAGFSDQLAVRSPTSNRCTLVHRRTGTLAKDSVARKTPLLVAAEIREIETGKTNPEVILSLCTNVRLEWLRELFPDDFSTAQTVDYEPETRRVCTRETLLFRDLVIESRPGPPPDPEAAATLLAEKVLSGELTLKHWGHEADQWVRRVNLLARHCPELGIAPIDTETRLLILTDICRGAVSFKDIKERPVLPALKNWISPAHRALVARHAPERIDLPNDRSPKLVYEEDGSVVVQARIQELYGVETRLAVAQGRVAVVLHILGPNQRPVQITQDLAGFWRNHYPQVRKELQRKYPKHEWR